MPKLRMAICGYFNPHCSKGSKSMLDNIIFIKKSIILALRQLVWNQKMCNFMDGKFYDLSIHYLKKSLKLKTLGLLTRLRQI
jgi:hypothetical protein